MSIETHSNQCMLVAVGLGSAVIVATESTLIQHEVQAVSAYVEDHSIKPPVEAGLYVWEGDIQVDSGGWAGSEPMDGDISWRGQFRKAAIADLTRFSMLN